MRGTDGIPIRRRVHALLAQARMAELSNEGDAGIVRDLQPVVGLEEDLVQSGSGIFGLRNWDSLSTTANASRCVPHCWCLPYQLLRHVSAWIVYCVHG